MLAVGIVAGEIDHGAFICQRGDTAHRCQCCGCIGGDLIRYAFQMQLLTVAGISGQEDVFSDNDNREVARCVSRCRQQDDVSGIGEEE